MEPNYTDEVLIATFLASGDSRVFTRLYQRYYSKVYASCLHLMGEPTRAQDQTQEIFSTVYLRLSGFRGQASFSTWLFVLTRHHCLSALGQQKKYRFVTLEADHGQVDDSFGEKQSLDERWDRAQDALNRLSPQDRQLLLRRYIGNQSVATLAGEARLSQSAVKMRLKRARDQVRLLHQAQVRLS